MKRKIQQLLVSKILPPTRGFIYRKGLRPKRGTVLYSPSLDAMYALKGFLRARKRN